jgi:chemotaxis protein MotB
MRRISICTIGILFAITSLPSCVANRKYVAEKNRAMQASADNLALNARITRLEDTISKLHSRVGALGNANENAANELSKTSSELNLTKEQITAQRQRLQQLQSFIDQQKKASEDLKKKIADALVGFNSKELTVTLKDGRVYISMEEALLFPSGSAQVNPRGKEAVAKVAGVLNTNTDINIDIEGHTDNVPIKTKLYADNWALSTARAVSIAHVLIDDYHVSPEKLIASGRSYYHPVATNATPEGRAQNRRTEIILEPKYDELMQLMNTSTATK